MKRFPFYLLLLLLPLLAASQEKRVYTVVGSNTSIVPVVDGSQATSGGLASTEGIWLDGNCNLYVSELGLNRVRKVNLETGIITTLAGRGDGTAASYGFAGDGGLATSALINGPYGLFADSAGNVYFADGRNHRIRRVDGFTGIITTVAGGGSSLGDGGPALDAEIRYPGCVYVDKSGNIYITASARIRKVSATTGIITTIAGTGENGFSGDNGLATDAKIGMNPGTMLEDAQGNLIFADRGTSRIRRIDKATGIITTLAGTTLGYSGDGGHATNAQFAGPISMALDIDGNLIIGDNGSDRMRIVDVHTGIVTTVAGVGNTTGLKTDGALALETQMHPEFVYLDKQGNLYYSNFGSHVRKITGFRPGLNGHKSDCLGTGVRGIDHDGTVAGIVYPNPAGNTLTVSAPGLSGISIINLVGQVVLAVDCNTDEVHLDIATLPTGVYVVRVTDASGAVAVRRVVKE